MTVPGASVLVEACVDSVESALAAERGGASRLELCDNLHDGGTTPSVGMIEAVKAAVRIPVVVIVRPRGGGFVYSAAELDVMRRDVAAALRSGADGVAIGILREDATIDQRHTRELVELAQGRPVTFHRAFDVARDLREALAALRQAGVARVLTSGGAATALEGAATIAELMGGAAAAGLTIMAGGSIRVENVAEVVRRSGVREIHVRGTRVRATTMTSVNERVRFRKPFPADEGAWEETDEALVRRLVELAG